MPEVVAALELWYNKHEEVLLMTTARFRVFSRYDVRPEGEGMLECARACNGHRHVEELRVVFRDDADEVIPAKTVVKECRAVGHCDMSCGGVTDHELYEGSLDNIPVHVGA